MSNTGWEPALHNHNMLLLDATFNDFKYYLPPSLMQSTIIFFQHFIYSIVLNPPLHHIAQVQPTNFNDLQTKFSFTRDTFGILFI